MQALPGFAGGSGTSRMALHSSSHAFRTTTSTPSDKSLEYNGKALTNALHLNIRTTCIWSKARHSRSMKTRYTVISSMRLYITISSESGALKYAVAGGEIDENKYDIWLV